MSNSNVQIGKNIKYLRTAFGESQLDLALSIGINSPTAISNYENGRRTPEPEIHHKIAMHYGITEDQLIHGDFSGWHFSNTAFNNIKKIQELGLASFPIISSKQAMANPLFKKGYDTHIRIKECIKSGVEPEDKDFEMCLNSYAEAIQDYELPEAVANMLWWYLLLEFIFLNKQISDEVDEMLENKITGMKLMQQFYLKNCDGDSYDTDVDDEEKALILEIEEGIAKSLIGIVKKTAHPKRLVKSVKLAPSAIGDSAVKGGGMQGATAS